MKTLVLPANDGGHILVGKVVQRAGVSQWFKQTRTGLRVTTKELAVKLLLTRGQVHRRHDVVLAVKGFGAGRKSSAIINRQEVVLMLECRYSEDYVELSFRSASSHWQLNRHWLGTYSTLTAKDGLRCVGPGSIAGTIG